MLLLAAGAQSFTDQYQIVVSLLIKHLKSLRKKSQLSETNGSGITMATKSFMHDAEQCVSDYHLKAAVTILDHSFGLYFSNNNMCIRNVC